MPWIAPRAPWDGGFQWERTPSGAHWIATSNQMQGADLWWPCKDHPADKALVSAAVTVPDTLSVVSNGTLLGVDDLEPGWRRYRWREAYPLATYLVGVAASNYVIRRQVRRRTAELSESKERFRQLAENIKDVFWVGSPDWRQVFYVSPAYQTIWGMPAEHVYAEPLSWLEPGPRLPGSRWRTSWISAK